MVNISNQLVKQLTKIKTDSNEIRDFKNKIEIVATFLDIKPAFLDLYSENKLFPLRRLSSLFKLKYMITDPIPLYCTRKPEVNESFMRASLEVWNSGRPIWIFSDTKVKTKISECLQGKRNPGFLLGYPECCTNWHEKNRASELESVFQDVEKAIVADHHLLNGYRGGSEEEMYKHILSQWRMPMPNYAFETHRQYPFVPHWACPSCLEGKSKGTEKINSQYKKLAMQLDPEYVQTIENSD